MPWHSRDKADGSNGAYIFESYEKIWSRASSLGAGLVQLAGVAQRAKVGLNMRTRAEWTICMLASCTQAICDVTLYDSFGLSALEFVINQAELSAVITEDAGKFIGLAAKCPSLKTVITLVVNDDLKSKAQQANIKVRILLAHATVIYYTVKRVLTVHAAVYAC